MRAFLAGSLVLIAAYALLQNGAPAAVGAAGNVSLGWFRRALSPDVAGVPNRAPASSATAEPPLAPGQGGPGIPIPGGG